MVFFSICPRSRKYLDYSIGDIPLRVVRDKGVDRMPDVDVQVTKLNSGYRHFKVDNGKGDSFKITIVIRRGDVVTGVATMKQKGYKINKKEVVNTVTNSVDHTSDFGDVGLIKYEQKATTSKVEGKWSVRGLLNYFMRNLTPLMITSDIIGLHKEELWVITDNKSRKQEYEDTVVWELEFTKYVAVKYGKFNKTSTGVQKALKNLKKKSTSTKSSKVTAKTKLRNQLKKCNIKVLVYSKKKKTVACVKTLQKYLNQNLGTKLTIDGWFGNETTKAVKKYQKKYSKSYGLKETGKINTKTYNVMLGKGKKITTNKTTVKNTNKKTSSKPKQIGKTKTITSSTKGILR